MQCGDAWARCPGRTVYSADGVRGSGIIRITVYYQNNLHTMKALNKLSTLTFLVSKR